MEIGLSTCGKNIDENLFKKYSDNHITNMEISVSSDEYQHLDYKSIKDFADRYGITLWSYHLPFSPFSQIDISSNRLKNATIRYYEDLMKKAREIGIKNFVVHPSAEPILPRFRKNRMEHSKESLFKLAEIGEKLDSTILVEDLPRTCLGRNSDEILELISVHEKLKVCFDTNHLLDVCIEDFINKVGNKIASTHISDYDNLNERHWLPGEGIINWNSLYNSLIAVGYKGPWLYEVGFSSPSSIKRTKQLNCSNFYTNAVEIFEDKKITVYGKPASGLLSWKIFK